MLLFVTLVVLGLLLISAGAYGALKSMGGSGRRFNACLLVMVLGVLPVGLGCGALGAHLQRNAERDQQAAAERVLAQVSAHQHQLYEQTGSYSDSHRSGVPATVAAELRERDWQLAMALAPSTGNLIARLTDAEGKLLGQRLLRTPVVPGISS